MWPFNTSKRLESLSQVVASMERKFDTRLSTVNARIDNCVRIEAALDARTKKLETCDITDQNIYRTVEDLKNRVPKGSAVSDFRFNELAGTVSRLERLISEMNAAWANAKREQELYLEERRAKTTVSRSVNEAKQLT